MGSFVSPPSFKTLSPASPASSRAKQKNRSTDTKHECLIRSVLWRNGYRYRKNLRVLPGKPDIVFVTEQVAVFCDGDFWHGRDWSRLSRKLRSGANGGYWFQKIKSNRARDRRNNRLLLRAGWIVVRVWETDIHSNPEDTARAIESVILERRRAIGA